MPTPIRAVGIPHEHGPADGLVAVLIVSRPDDPALLARLEARDRDD